LHPEPDPAMAEASRSVAVLTALVFVSMLGLQRKAKLGLLPCKLAKLPMATVAETCGS
jgi:hypothetical protein